MAQWTGKKWCFTINAKKGSDEANAFWQLSEVWEELNRMECDYLIVKGECGKSNNYHLQGYVRFPVSYTMKEVKLMLCSKTAHVEKIKGDESDNIRYVSKKETAWDAFPLVEKGSLEHVIKCKERNPFANGHWRICDECRIVYMNSQAEFESYMETPEMRDFMSRVGRL